MMPTVRASSQVYGEVTEKGLEKIPIAGIAGISKPPCLDSDAFGPV